MAHVVVLGGSGYAGSHIAAEAAKRGLSVTSWSRSLPDEQVSGVTYRTGDVLNLSVLENAVSDADVVVGALSPRGALDGKMREVYSNAARFAEVAGARFGVVGGAGSLLVSEGGPTVSSGPDFPEAFQSEAAQLADVLGDLRANDGQLDWFFLSPAGTFGAYAPGEPTGSYRLGGDVLVTDENGESFISGADYAQAFVDEIIKPAHHRQRFAVAH
ncbi:MAG: NAD(P)-dependent oxidoreductase [Ancrocorticia sp.]|uniref:NAD(P)-dependent oxidoreductase n=1 Tax=Ancrocorticia sp. TaxID=2593684 RepID=UPI003F92856B